MRKNNSNKRLYLLLVIVSILIPITRIQAQTPAGLNYPIHFWLESNDLIPANTTDGLDISSWTSKSPNAITLGQYASDPLPRINFSGYNYTPAVSFYWDDDLSATVNRNRKLYSNGQTLAVDRSTAYYVFYVSNLDTENTIGVGTVFSIDAANNLYGWNVASSVGRGYAAFSTGTVTSSSSKTAGINTVLVPNDYRTAATNTSPIRSYLNGENLTVGTAQHRTGNSAGVVTLGGTGTGTGNYFFGDIYEVLVLTGTQYQYMTDLELQKIHSYFALKYGLTINVDYVNSNGSPIWTHTDNTGYNTGIFGLINDVNGNLKVNQAKSSDDQFLTAFVGDLKDFNVQNNATILNDGEYIMFGDNGVEEWLISVDYKAGQTTWANGITNDKDINFRNNRVLKVRTNIANPSINFRTHVGANYVAVCQDENFDPSNTRIYPITDGIATNVDIADGEYISVFNFASAPGGVVNGLKLWLRSDDLSSLTFDGSGNVIGWKDQTGNPNVYTFDASTYAAKTKPKFVSCDSRVNYNSAVYFDLATATLSTKSGPMSSDSPDDFTSFVIYHATAFDSNDRLYTHSFGSPQTWTSTSRYPAMGFAPGDGQGRVRNEGTGRTSINGTVKGFYQNTTALHMIHTRRDGSPTGTDEWGAGPFIRHDFGGYPDYVGRTGTGDNRTGDGFGNGFRMSQGGNLGGGSYYNAQFRGLISEIFFYERALTSEQQGKIRTYLGMKYAITLDANLDNDQIGYTYILSNGTVVWDGNTAPSINFHRNVAGLVRDDESGMFINKSKSSANGATVTMMVPGHNACGQGTQSELSVNHSAIYWGHNGLVGNNVNFDPSDPDVCGEVENMTGRVWLVKKTNLAEQTVTMRFSASDGFPYASSAYEVFLLVGESAEALNNGQYLQAIPTTFVDGEHQINYTFTEEYTYFALGAKASPSACETCGFSGTKKIEFTNSTWARGDLDRVFDVGDNVSVRVNAKIENTGSANSQFYNRYPRASSTKSLREYRRRNLDQYMVTEIIPHVTGDTTNYIAAASTFQIYEIDREGQRYDEVEVFGICSGAKVFPKLSYTVAENRSSYTIVGNKAVGKRRPTSSYTNNAGKMYVEFEYPVEKVIVRHKATGRTNDITRYSQRIGIGPVEFTCPEPLPPVNEDGLIFTKQGTSEVFLCEEVLYTFRIYNTNCAGKAVNLNDVLPNGMKWVSESVSTDEYAITDETTFNSYGTTNTLNIGKLFIPGGMSTTVRARAIFDTNATANTYENQGEMKYEILEGGVTTEKTLLSCDRLTEGCATTKTIANPSVRPEPIEVTTVSVSKVCYTEDNEIEITVKINNPNAPITLSTIEVSYNEEFTYIGGFSSTIGGITPKFDNDGGTDVPGYFYMEGFTLPSNESTVTFKVQAPDKNNLSLSFAEDGTTMLDESGLPTTDPDKQGVTDFGLDFELSSDESDICLGATLAESRISIRVPYCSSVPCIISNKNVTNKLIK
ncbi:MAG: hypothetical protein E6772_02960 [Dysgonomonas sp.]|nr:hypothetical protein [Dysgonomonas sp.]